jgi:hypothetical protein
VIHADLGSLFRLAGAQVKGDGASLRLTLLWQSLKPTDVNYMVFVHVQQPGFPLTAGDGPTAQGYYSTNLWRAGDWIIDERVVELPATFDPARDQVIIGMYDLTTLQRLPGTDSAGNAAGDSILIHP